jgi:hypothetical protein
MQEKELMAAILSHLETMPAEERKRKVADFAAEDPSLQEFLLQHFPGLYREVFGPPGPEGAKPEKLQQRNTKLRVISHPRLSEFHSQLLGEGRRAIRN